MLSLLSMISRLLALESQRLSEELGCRADESPKKQGIEYLFLDGWQEIGVGKKGRQ